MTATRKNVWLAVLAVATLQSAFLGWIVWERVSLLKSGREITIDVIPVDPRDLFRGDYVVLAYDITQVEARLLPAGFKPGGPLFVTLAREAGRWRIAAVSDRYEAADGQDRVVLAARLAEPWSGMEIEPNQTYRLSYGLESYFVPEGEGRALETLVREKKVQALIAVGSRGETALKGLMSDGRLIHAQPVL